jgi:hypothetical protein
MAYSAASTTLAPPAFFEDRPFSIDFSFDLVYNGTKGIGADCKGLVK